MKVFACYRSTGKGMVVCAARSKEEAYGAMVLADDNLKYDYLPSQFFELEGVTCEFESPRMFAESGKD